MIRGIFQGIRRGEITLFLAVESHTPPIEFDSPIWALSNWIIDIDADHMVADEFGQAID